MRDIASFNGATALAVDRGVVVGTAPTAGGAGHAFAYDVLAPPGSLQDLVPLSGGSSSGAVAVDGDIVVGQSDRAGTDDEMAVFWTIDLATVTTVTASLNPGSVGAPVTYTARVRPGPTGGTVGLTDNGAPLAGCQAAAVVAGIATCTVTYTDPGAHSIVATYSGTGPSLPSTSERIGEIVSAAPCASFAGCDLSGINLTGALLLWQDLRGVDMHGSTLLIANLYHSDLAGANLEGASLLLTTMGSANLTGARLAGADARAANLRDAYLFFADLTGANLQYARIMGALLVGADLTDADLGHAEAVGAGFAGATFSNTTCPDLTNSDDNGGTCLGHLARVP
jgi:hypothetical protein